MSRFDPNKLNIKAPPCLRCTPSITGEHKIPSRRKAHNFLKGPIQLDWLESAAQLPGKALHVGIAIWFRSGLLKSDIVPLTNVTLSRFGVDRHAKRRALRALEDASLISVHREPGKNPVITLRDAGDS